MVEPTVAVGTIVTRSHLAFARVLASSLVRFHPRLRCSVLVVDGAPETAVATEGEIELVEPCALGLTDAASFTFRHDRESLVRAVKPWLLEWMLRRSPSALYLDADMLVLASLEPLLAEVPRRALLLTPHLLEPLEGPGAPTHELAILRAGTFNGGVLGVSRSPTAETFLAWWRDRLASHCRLDMPVGLNYDQRWLDLAPAFFADTTVWRDPGVNCGHWNLHERPIALDGNELLAAGLPCRLFHFSGFDPRRPEVLTCHSDGLTPRDAGALSALCARYAELLLAAGHLETSREPYGHDRFDNGVPIPAIARQLHAELGEAAAAFGNPFGTAHPGSYWRWLLAPAAPQADGAGPVSRLWYGIHRARRDLQLAFPSPLGRDRDAFLAWAAAHGIGEHGVAAELAALG